MAEWLKGAVPAVGGVVATAGTCLSQSLLFCLQRSRVKVASLETVVKATVAWNAQGRLLVTPRGRDR